MPCRLLTLLLSALLLIALDCASLLHESGHAHGPARTVSGAPRSAELVPLAAAPADSSCSPTGSDAELTGRQQVRAPITGAAEAEATGARPAALDGAARVPGEARRFMSGRFVLCALCRWRT
ncbi:hypothetical protein ACWGI8_35540 [Streptomyces sp. NPDC054841]